VGRAGKRERFDAAVPGCIHADLLAAGKIDDPFFRDNETRTLWVGETDWVYERRFRVSDELLASDRVVLRCEGLDTLATITLNGARVGRTDNMFRVWEFDAKKFLRAGENTISVRFDSPLPYLRRKNKKFRLPAWGVGDFRLDSGGWIRKETCNFGFDWGPKLVTCGIWRPIRLVAFDVARLGDVRIEQEHFRSGRVALDVRASVDNVRRASLRAHVTIALDNRTVAETNVPVKGGKARAKLEVKKAKLWWPNGMGEQPLYEVTAELVDETGELLDTKTKRIGLRTLELERKKDKWGESFRFAVNGVPFFAKGANWIPADALVTRVSRDDYEYLIASAAAANMNMLRVWGGGIYEDDVFYDLCDEFGICVWQDFMFACGTYPAFDAAFLENVRAEARDNVERLRHHACIALWCGNNELESGLVGAKWDDDRMSWTDYRRLFDRLLPAVVKTCDPGRAYWPGSPHSPRGVREDSNSPKWGDAHVWGVWFERKPFEWYRTTGHRFCSEFGFQSFPEPKTVRGYTLPEDRNVTSFVMEHHQRSGIGNAVIMAYMLDWFRVPKNFEMTLWLSQIQHGMAMKYAVEHWRRNMPRTMGALYWQLDDCWPVASWSSIDYHGRWKALHYMARRFYAPLLVSGVEDPEKGTVRIHVTSDLPGPRTGKLTWTLTDTAGAKTASESATVKIAPLKSTCVETLKLGAYLKRRGARDLMLWLELETPKEETCTNFVSFARPKHMKLRDPRLSARVRAVAENCFAVKIRAAHPALWAWLELPRAEAHYSDNFFHVRPGRPVEVLAHVAKPMTREAFEKQLILRSLVDTY